MHPQEIDRADEPVAGTAGDYALSKRRRLKLTLCL